MTLIDTGLTRVTSNTKIPWGENGNKSSLNAEIPSAAKISMQHKIVNMLDPQSHHNPQPKRSSSSGTLNMIPP